MLLSNSLWRKSSQVCILFFYIVSMEHKHKTQEPVSTFSSQGVFLSLCIKNIHCSPVTELSITSDQSQLEGALPLLHFILKESQVLPCPFPLSKNTICPFHHRPSISCLTAHTEAVHSPLVVCPVNISGNVQKVRIIIIFTSSF